jgi:hypothetical protein
MSSAARNVFSDELKAIKKESHRSPRPTFGTPTLCWHIGIWPNPGSDWLDADVNIEIGDLEDYQKICNRDGEKKTAFFNGINDVIQALQDSSANQFSNHNVQMVIGKPPGWVTSPSFRNSGAASEITPFPVVQESSLAFTLWWYSEAAEGRPASSGDPSPEALRVRVQVEAQRDHITLSFFLDASKPWNADRCCSSSEATGQLRKRILAHAEAVDEICGARAKTCDPTKPIVPERELGSDNADSMQKAKALLAACDFLYEEIWDAFLKDFGLTLEKIATPQGQIFANFRSAVISTSGIPIENGTGIAPHDAFERFDASSNECNAVMRGFWPFVRRMTPYADEKEHVACAVMGYRALYVTALNTDTNYVEGQECKNRLQEVPAGSLPEMPDPGDPSAVIPPDDPRFENRAMRALLLVKGEPNVRQLGRIVERFNSLGTMRIFALKSYPLVRDASNHIRICGERLDEVVGAWTRSRAEVEDAYKEQTQGLDPQSSARDKGKKQKLDDEKNDKLSKIADEIEKYLLYIHADLDTVSKRVPGGLLFRVSRANYYAQMIKINVKLLKIKNVETWVTYEQFLERSVLPTYEFIVRTGQRLEGLRSRLQVITQSIQTSSVYLQTLATRQNTEELRNLTAAQRRIARSQLFLNILFSILSIMFAVVSSEQIFGYEMNLRNLWSLIWESFRGE